MFRRRFLLPPSFQLLPPPPFSPAAAPLRLDKQGTVTVKKFSDFNVSLTAEGDLRTSDEIRP